MRPPVLYDTQDNPDSDTGRFYGPFSVPVRYDTKGNRLSLHTPLKETALLAECKTVSVR
jgi:hypothetical protein